MGLTTLDIIVLVVVALAAILGAVRGFVTEVLSLFAWIFVAFALRLAHLPLTHLLTGKVGTASGAAVLAFVLIGGIAWFAGRMVARGIGARTRRSVLGPLDRAMGFGFGVLKGLVLASLGFLLVVLVTDTVWGGEQRRPPWLKHSRTFPLLNATSTYMAKIVERRRRGEPLFGPDNATDSADPDR